MIINYLLIINQRLNNLGVSSGASFFCFSGIFAVSYPHPWQSHHGWGNCQGGVSGSQSCRDTEQRIPQQFQVSWDPPLPWWGHRAGPSRSQWDKLAASVTHLSSCELFDQFSVIHLSSSQSLMWLVLSSGVGTAGVGQGGATAAGSSSVPPWGIGKLLLELFYPFQRDCVQGNVPSTMPWGIPFLLFPRWIWP